MDDMSQSPRGCSPTDKRIEYLVKGKAARSRRNEDRRNFYMTQTGGTDASTNAFGRRKMTVDNKPR